MTSDPYTSLAKKAVETCVKSRKIIEVPKNLSKEMSEKAGVFVSIHCQDGSLRGCIGTFLPTMPSVAQEIIRNALSAAFNDPRFPPITEKELKNLVFSVDILSPPKKLDAKRYTLNPKRYGLIIFAPDGRRSLLLPDIPGVDTPEQQIAICRSKADIGPEEGIELQTFTVERHKEK